MTKVTVKVKKPKPLKAGEMRKALTDGAQKAADAMALDMDKLTKYWSNPVKFIGKIKFRRTLIEIHAKPKSPRSKWAVIFGYIDQGTGLYGPKKAKYKIVPKRKKALFFASNSKAGSKANSVSVGKSNKGTRDTVRPSVMHPGIKSRNWSKLRADEWRRQRKLSKFGLEAIKVSVNVSGNKYT